MGTYNKSVLTEAGLTLIVKTMTGEAADINITRVVTDDSDYSTVENVTTLERPLHERHSFLISSKHVVNQKTIFLRTVITNKDIYDAGYRIGALCVLAEDPDKGEILYAIATAEEGKGDHFDAYNGYLPSTITVDFYIEVGNAEQVIINGGASGNASSADLDELRQEMEEGLAKLEGATGTLKGSGVPPDDIEAVVGQHYIDTDSQLVYICTAVQENGQRVWALINVAEAIAAHNDDPSAHSMTILTSISTEIGKMTAGGFLVTTKKLNEALANSSGAILDEITIPAETWVLDEALSSEEGNFVYYADVPVERAQATHFPAAAFHREALAAAAAAGVTPVMRAMAGSVRFWAKEPPRIALNVSLALLSGGKDSAGQGYGVVNANANTVTREELSAALSAHDADPAAHPALREADAGLDARLSLVEMLYSTDIKENPFTVQFNSLEGLAAAGVWDQSGRALAF